MAKEFRSKWRDFSPTRGTTEVSKVPKGAFDTFDTPIPGGFPDNSSINAAPEVCLCQPPVGDGQTPPLDRPPATEQELRRLYDHWREPGAFTRWLEWAMNYTDPAEGHRVIHP